MADLHPGSVARLYRNGGDLVEQVTLPVAGRVEIRGLQPGRYVAVDELGGSRTFTVAPFAETVALPLEGSLEGSVVVGAGSPAPRGGGPRLVGRFKAESAPVYPPAPKVQRKPRAAASADVRVPGEPGAADLPPAA